VYIRKRDFSHFPMATVGPSGIPGVAPPPPAEFAGASKRNSPIEARAGAMQLVGQARAGCSSCWLHNSHRLRGPLAFNLSRWILKQVSYPGGGVGAHTEKNLPQLRVSGRHCNPRPLLSAPLFDFDLCSTDTHKSFGPYAWENYSTSWSLERSFGPSRTYLGYRFAWGYLQLN
jgi:hypothetical protein